jgi:formylglycine-generating enzyme required for sulfatase activity
MIKGRILKKKYIQALVTSTFFFASISVNALEVENGQNKISKKLISVGDYPLFLVNIPAGQLTREFREDEYSNKKMETHINSFYLMETEVTWDFYLQCVNSRECPEILDTNAGFLGGDEGFGKGARPVINITWLEITEHFIPWINKTTGMNFRLPSEIEWEYAARSRTNELYNTGSCISGYQANFNDTKPYNNCTVTNINKEKTVPVKSYSPNAWGVYDMHGNVSEWTSSCFSVFVKNSGKRNSNCGIRVIKGGSWAGSYEAQKFDFNSENRIDYRLFMVGFRLALDEKI